MGNNVITKTVEELYVTNNILAPNYENKSGEEMPDFRIYTMGANENRTKVYATVTLENIPFGDMLVYLLNYNKQGNIASFDYIGRAGYHIAGVGQRGRLFEYDPKEKGNLSEPKLKMIGASTKGVTKAVENHVVNLQASFVAGKE